MYTICSYFRPTTYTTPTWSKLTWPYVIRRAWLLPRSPNIAAHYTEIRNKNRLTRLINLFSDNTHICYRAMEISYSSLVFWSTSFLSGIYSAHDRNASVYYVNVRQLLAYMIYEPVAQFSLVIHYTQFYYTHANWIQMALGCVILLLITGVPQLTRIICQRYLSPGIVGSLLTIAMLSLS